MTLNEQRELAKRVLIERGFCSTYEHGGIHELIDCTRKGTPVNFQTLLPFFSTYYGSTLIEGFAYHLFAYEDKTMLHYLMIKCAAPDNWRKVVPALAYDLAIVMREDGVGVNTMQDLNNVADVVASCFTSALSFYFAVAAQTVLHMGGSNGRIRDKYLNFFASHEIYMSSGCPSPTADVTQCTLKETSFSYCVGDGASLIVWRA